MCDTIYLKKLYTRTYLDFPQHTPITKTFKKRTVPAKKSEWFPASPMKTDEHQWWKEGVVCVMLHVTVTSTKIWEDIIIRKQLHPFSRQCAQPKRSHKIFKQDSKTTSFFTPGLKELYKGRLPSWSTKGRTYNSGAYSFHILQISNDYMSRK
jgi:hypothetical protein